MGNTDAYIINKQNEQQTQGTDKTIYIGVFFDGTGNNKYQVTMGKLFRMKEALAKAEGKSEAQVCISEARGKGRAFWENNSDLTQSQLDELFFGYEGAGEDADFVERRLDSVHTAELPGGLPNDAALKLRTYSQAATEFHRKANQKAMNDTDWKQLKKSSGSGDVQGRTYSNVAILEALYKSDNQTYFPLYVEGAGTDMDMSKSQSVDYWGGAHGASDTGVWKKVGHARDAVTRICQRFLICQGMSNLTVHLSIYGFSRGATEARMLAHIYNPQNTKTEGVQDALKEVGRTEFLNDPEVTKKLDFVGIFDTVSSQGLDVFSSRLFGSDNNDVDDLHLYGVSNSDFTLHLCAMDEYRTNFALTDIESVGSRGLELFLPGCHTDLGGGFTIGVDDWRSIDAKDYNSWSKVWQSLCFKMWNSEGNSYTPITPDNLRCMGWLPDTALTKSQLQKEATDSVVEECGAVYGASEVKIEFKRYTRPGYSNIPLHLIHAKAVDKAMPFAAIPLSYSVASGLLTTLHNRWKGMLSSTGQCFISISTKEYHDLRATYLHYSGNDTLVDSNSSLVDGHEKVAVDGNRKLITRRIYRGLKDIHRHYYLHDISATTAPPAKKFKNPNY